MKCNKQKVIDNREIWMSGFKRAYTYFTFKDTPSFKLLQDFIMNIAEYNVNLKKANSK